MKKLLVLVMVLSVAGLANAGISLEVAKTELATGESIAIQIVNSLGGRTGFTLGYLIVPEGQPGDLSDPVILSGNKSRAVHYSEYGWGIGYEITLADTNPGGAGLVAGPQMSISYTAPMIDGIYDVAFYNDALGYDAPEAILTFFVGIPEPITMLLLGLGSLFLRRK